MLEMNPLMYSLTKEKKPKNTLVDAKTRASNRRGNLMRKFTNTIANAAESLGQ